jgi:hypothetical protein
VTKVTVFCTTNQYTTDFFTNESVKSSLSSPPQITTEEEPGTSLEPWQHRELSFLGFGVTGPPHNTLLPVGWCGLLLGQTITPRLSLLAGYSKPFHHRREGLVLIRHHYLFTHPLPYDYPDFPPVRWGGRGGVAHGSGGGGPAFPLSPAVNWHSLALAAGREGTVRGLPDLNKMSCFHLNYQTVGLLYIKLRRDGSSYHKHRHHQNSGTQEEPLYKRKSYP